MSDLEINVAEHVAHTEQIGPAPAQARREGITVNAMGLLFVQPDGTIRVMAKSSIRKDGSSVFIPAGERFHVDYDVEVKK